ncbi:MAG: beta-L-arabinofuranosidase domain-containing protein [Prevotella sp.]
MKRKFLRRKLMFLSLLLLSTIMSAQDKVSIVDLPLIQESNNYSNFQAPLQKGRLLKLPVGKIKPQGWLLKFLQLQRDGLNGKLGTISAWLDKNNNQWLSDTGDHGWEEVPYWLRGYCSAAYILDDAAMKNEAQIWFDAVLSHQKPDGFFGPQNIANGKPEVWAQMIMLWALQTYYEHSQDARVLNLMKKYFMWELSLNDNDFLEDYWEKMRGGDNMWSVIWYYNLTGDQDVLPLIHKLHTNTADWTQPTELPNWHGVNVAQGFREPATYYLYQADSALIKNSYNDFQIMTQRYGQVPGGMYGADENARIGYGDPRQGTETCAIVEQLASDEIMMGITGDPFWADHCENVAFNTLPAALTSDMKALRYLTSPNMAISDGKNHYPSIDNNLLGMLAMNPFSSRCCQHNHGMGWPYYIEHMVMATTDNGLATMLYGASETTAMVDNKHEIKLIQETNYPFEEQIMMTIRTESAVTFPLYLRIPKWSKQTAISINGVKVDGNIEPNKYVRVERTWKDGDKIVLSMPMEISSTVWTANQASVSVDYGPLTLSLKINEQYNQRDSRDPAIVQDDSHWQSGVDASLWPTYEIFPASAWNYSLVVDQQNLPFNITVTRKPWPADNFPFTEESVPLVFEAKGKQIPSWTFDATGMTSTLPSKFAARSVTTDDIQLIPMGAGRLRISAFPKVTVDATGITNVETTNQQLVNVYTIDGRLIRSNVIKFEAIKDLQPCLYR